MNYTPKQARHLQKLCQEHEDHLWRPITEYGVPPELWTWTCARCAVRLGRAPVKAANISLKELERMVDDSLKIADHVYEDNQSVEGELWLMRSSLWLYRPYKYHLVYHILRGVPFVLIFRYQNMGRHWRNIADTDSYRKLLLESDVARASIETRIIV